MSWVRYDDEFNYNRKITMLKGEGMAGLAAIGLHLCLNAHARHQGTGGRIEAGEINVIAGGPHGRKLARLLVSVGMLDEIDGGAVAIHDCADYGSPDDPAGDVSADEKRRSLSMKRAAAGRIGGSNSASKRQANREQPAKQPSTPVPVPVPNEQVPPPPTVSSGPAPVVVEPSIKNTIVLTAAGMLADREPAGKITSRSAWVHSVAQRLLRDHGAWIDAQPLDVEGPTFIAVQLANRASGADPTGEHEKQAASGAGYGAAVLQAQHEGDMLDRDAFLREIEDRPQVWRDAAVVAYDAARAALPAVEAEVPREAQIIQLELRRQQ